MISRILAVLVALGSASSAAQGHRPIAQIYTYSTIAYPGATTTNAYGINKSGEIVGYWTIPYQSIGGFLDIDGAFQLIQYTSTSSTYAKGINNLGQVVGDFDNSVCANAQEMCAYVYTDGAFEILDFPGSESTTASGINDTGQVVGVYFNGSNNGYLYQSGAYKTLNFPGAKSSYLTGINDSGEIVGYYDNVYNSSSSLGGSFVYSGGKWTEINIPGGGLATGINGAGQVTGIYYGRDGNYHGFVETNGSFAFLNFPGATTTWALGISDNGQVVGFYSGSGCTQNQGCSFLATPVKQ